MSAPASGYQRGDIRMDKYWNFVATPLLFGIIAFGGYVLFATDDIQLVDRDTIREETRLVKAAPAQPQPARVAAPIPAAGVAPAHP